jgi:hypothetical protein
MASRTRKPKAQQSKVQLKDLKTKSADNVKGGALNAYFYFEGEKQGKKK